MTVWRQFNADKINKICNHPDVFDHIRHPDTVYVDMKPVVNNRQNIVLLATGGGVIFQKLRQGVYEGHLQFLPNYRGRYALRVLRECAQYMFTRTDASVLVGRTPHNNQPALAMNRLLGMEFIKVHPRAWRSAKGGLVDLHEYHLTKAKWIVCGEKYAS